MKHPTKVSYLDAGSVGGLPVRVPITTVGEGNPHIAVMCCLHGDETAGLVIARYFLRELMKSDALQGSVSIITAANPFALATRTRVAVSDYFDLNRTGRGKGQGNLTERLASLLCEFLSQCSFFIDLHEFSMTVPTQAIYIPSNQNEVDQRIVQAIATFSPSFVWAMKLTLSEEAKYSGSLLATLINEGIPAFAVETSRLAELSLQTIQEVVEGLIEVMKLEGAIAGPHRSSQPLAFVRQEVYSSHAGIWVPKATLLSQIQAGEVIGEITSLDLLEDIPVYAHTEGTLIQVASADFVDTGTTLFALGSKDPDFALKLQSL